MGNSLIHFQKNTLWIQDGYLEPIIYFVSKLLSEKITVGQIDSKHVEWFQTYNDELKNLFMGASDGALDFEFDVLNEDDYRLSVIKDLLVSIFSFLNSIDVDLSANQFDEIGGYSFGNYSNWNQPTNTKLIAKKVLKILDLIADKN